MLDIKVTADKLRSENNELYKSICDESGKMSTSDFATTTFWHYTKLDTVDKILEGGELHLSCMSETNDTRERDLHEDRDMLNIICFCNSDSEKIPMWYLYSGVDGKGAAIGFTPATLMELIRSIKTAETDSGEAWKTGEEFDLMCGWVYYRKREAPSQVKYKGKWYSVYDSDKFAKDNYFVKDYPWEYEKEFRIIAINKTEKSASKVRIKIPDSVMKKLKIRLAPETNDKTAIFEKEGFKKYLDSRIFKSGLRISMGLLQRNCREYEEYMKRVRNNESERKKYLMDVCDKIHCQEKCLEEE